MPEMRHGKLVRDRIPTIIRSRGEQARTSVLAPSEFTPALQAATFKRVVRGGFAERVWLESTSDDPAVRN